MSNLYVNRLTPLRLHLPVLCIAIGILSARPSRGDQEYVVRSGDTLSEIARLHDTTAPRLARHNGISLHSTLHVGQRLLLPDDARPPKIYIIRKGDTLEEVAGKFGIDTGTLAAHNEISDPDRIRVGQRLYIPGRSSTWNAATSPHSDLFRRLDEIPVSSGRWRYIVIHHSASKEGDSERFDRYHRRVRHMEHGLAYHFVIGNGRGMGDGQIDVGARWNRQLHGGHLASSAQNQISIGICLVGNFNETHPTRRQLASLRELVLYLRKRCSLPVSSVQTHREINSRPTACPGKHFPTSEFRVQIAN